MKKYSLFKSLSQGLSNKASNKQSFIGALTPNRSSGWKHLVLLFLFMGTIVGSYAQTTASATWFGASQTTYSPTIVGSISAPVPTLTGYPQLTQGSAYPGAATVYQLATGTGNPLIVARNPASGSLFYGDGTTTTEASDFSGVTYSGTVSNSLTGTDARSVDFKVSPPTGSTLTINHISMNVKSPVGAYQTFVVGYSIDGGGIY